MKSTADSATLRFVLPLCLCTAEGVLMGFFPFVLLPWLQQHGVSPARADAHVGMMVLPFALKILWAPWVDRRRSNAQGPWRTWILVGQGGMGLACTALALVEAPATQLTTVTCIGATAMGFMALQDVATDGFLVTGIPDAERPRVNAGVFLGQLLGMLVASTIVAEALAKSWRAMALTMSAILLALLVAPLVIREGPGVRAEHDAALRSNEISVAATLKILAHRPNLITLAVGLAFRTLAQVAQTSDVSLTTSRGWAPEHYSTRFGVAFAVGALIGAVFAPRLARQARYVRTVVVAAIAYGLVLVAFGALPNSWPNERSFILRWVATGAAAATGTVALSSIFQRAADTRTAATHVSVYTSVANAGAPLGTWLAAGVLQCQSGYTSLYLALGIFALLTASIAPWMNDR